jgi:hypothetical protein
LPVAGSQLPVKSGTRPAAELVADNWQPGLNFYGKTSSSGRHGRTGEKRQEEDI